MLKILKIPLNNNDTPHVFVKMNDIDNRYRISVNYQYLNEKYGLKMKMIRDLNKIEKENDYFQITNNVVKIKYKPIQPTPPIQTWQLGRLDNTIDVQRMLIQKGGTLTTLLIFKRNYYDDINYSIFFSSNHYNTINEFLRSK